MKDRPRPVARYRDPMKKLRRKARTSRGQATLDILRRIDKSQWWTPERLEAAQFKALAKLLTHARKTVPYYMRSHCCPVN